MSEATQQAVVPLKLKDGPKAVLWREIKDWVGAVHPLGTEVLVCVYKEQQDLGIKGLDGRQLVRTDVSMAEAKYQGKVGMVVALGPAAFEEDERHRWGGLAPKVGDWVIANVSEGWPLDIGPKSYGKDRFRFVEDVNVRAILDDPDLVR